MWEQVLKPLGLCDAARLHHGGSKRALDGVQIVLAWPPCELHDAVQLVHGAAAWEDGLAIQQLTQDATWRTR